jgi:hypothetical protein
MKNLRARAWVALAVLAAVMGLLLFVPAGTLRYWHAWVYLAIFTGASGFTTRPRTLGTVARPVGAWVVSPVRGTALHRGARGSDDAATSRGPVERGAT